jgi:hypothetical protein
MAELPTAINKLRALWEAGSYRKALRLAASWPRLGEQKDAIQKGWAAASNKTFYAELGYNPAALERAGLDAVAARYGLPQAPERLSEKR